MKLMSLRYDGSCRRCGARLAARETAFYDTEARNISCIGCETAVPPAGSGSTPPVTPALDVGVAGAGPQREYDRRVAKRSAALDARWGRFAGIAKALSSEPRSTTAFATGAAAERRLAGHLEHVLGSSATILHSRRMPGGRGDIDHIVVAASGVWVIDAKSYRGRVEVRDAGPWWRSDRRLYVNGRDRSALVEGMVRQASAVHTVLAASGAGSPPVHPVLLFTDSEWGWFAKPIEVGGVHVMWASKLCELIVAGGPLDAAAQATVAGALGRALPAVRGRAR